MRKFINGKLLGIPLALFIIIGIVIELVTSTPNSVTMANPRRPGDDGQVAAPASTSRVTVPPAGVVILTTDGQDGQISGASGFLKEFSTPGELATWAKATVDYYKQQDAINPPVAPKLVPTSVWDCDDYSERLQRKALSDGYLVSMQLISGGQLLGAHITNYGPDHMGDITIIGNNMYYIEPLDGHVALIGPKD